VAAENRTPSPAVALERLGRLSLRDQSMETLLQTVVDLARGVAGGDGEASVSLLVKDQPKTVVSTGDLATDMDESQYARGHGPCLDAARSGEPREIADTRTEERWPDYARRAAERGNLSSLSMPLVIDVDDQVTGALNFYSRQAQAFDEGGRSAATGFAGYASVALSNMHAYERARDVAEGLRIALESRAVIDQAKGILMERYRLTADQAFQVLVHSSSTTNRKLRDIAEQLVATGDLPRGGGSSGVTAPDADVPRGTVEW
jgi:GAF domain-containing protein